MNTYIKTAIIAIVILGLGSCAFLPTFDADTKIETATFGEEGYSINYVVEEGNATITSFVKDDDFNGILVIDKLNGNPVTAIDANAFNNCRSLESITLPDTLIRIGSNAFSGCDALKSVTMPDGVTSIGSGAFGSCSSLQSVDLPENLTSIGSNTFYNCKTLESVTIPDSVTSIGSNAFYGCAALESVDLPENLTSIGGSAFYNCDALKSVTIPESVTAIMNGTFNKCDALESVDLPEKLTSIGDYAFSECVSLKSINLPDALTTIGSSSFFGTDMTTIIIPDSVVSIGSQAFYYSSDVVIVGQGVTDVQSGAFYRATIITLGGIPDTLKDSLVQEYGSDKVYYVDASDDGSADNLTYRFVQSENTLSFNLATGILNIINNSAYNLSVDYSWKINGQDSGETSNTISTENRHGMYEMDLTLTSGHSSITVAYQKPILEENQYIVTFKNGETTVGYAITDDSGRIQNPPNEPSIKGVTFESWKTDDGQTFDLETGTVSGDMTLHATYTVDEFEIELGTYSYVSGDSGFRVEVVDPSPGLDYTYVWESDGSTVGTGSEISKPDISKQYTVTVTATYNGATSSVSTSTVQVTATISDGFDDAEIRVDTGFGTGSLNDYKFSGTAGNIYLPAGDYEVWIQKDGYSFEHIDISVSEDSGASITDFEYTIEPPNVSVEYKGETVTGGITTQDKEVVLTAVATHPNDACTYTYQWYNGKDLITDQTGETLTISSPGDYRVTAIADDGTIKSKESRSFEITVNFKTVTTGDDSTTTVIEYPDGSKTITTVENDRTTVEKLVVDNISFTNVTTNVVQVTDNGSSSSATGEGVISFSDGSISNTVGADAVTKAVENATEGGKVDLDSFRLTIQSRGAVDIAPDAFGVVVENDVELIVSDGTVSIEIDADVARTMSAQTDNIEIVTDLLQPGQVPEPAVADAAGSATIVEVSALVNGEPVASLGGAVLVEVDYDIPQNQNPTDVRAFYIDDDGGIHLMSESGYSDGKLWFVTDHFSYYIGEDKDLLSSPGQTWEDDDLPPFIPAQPSEDDSVTIVACAAAAVVAALMAVFLILTYRKD